MAATAAHLQERVCPDVPVAAVGAVAALRRPIPIGLRCGTDASGLAPVLVWGWLHARARELGIFHTQGGGALSDVDRFLKYKKIGQRHQLGSPIRSYSDRRKFRRSCLSVSERWVKLSMTALASDPVPAWT